MVDREQSGAELIQKLLKDKVDVLENAILTGVVKSMDDFMFLKGQLRGVKTSLDIIQGVVNSLEKK